jgi:hypothetical protein
VREMYATGVTIALKYMKMLLFVDTILHCLYPIHFLRIYSIPAIIRTMAAYKLLFCLCLFLLGVRAQPPPQCPIGCNPNPGANTCSWSTAENCIYPSPSTPNPRAACACRAGYKATVPGILDTDTTKQWRLPADEGNFRVWVAQGVACDTLCEVSTGTSPCQEVVELPAACLSNSVASTSTLPLFSLGAQVTFPEDILGNVLRSVDPGATLSNNQSDGSRYYYDGNLLIGYFDNATGETSVYSKLGLLLPSNGINTQGIFQYSTNLDIVPDDDTQYSIINGRTLAATQQTFGGSASAPADYLKEVIIQRTVPYEDKVYSVYGPGTKASFKFGADGTVKSLQHRWRTAQRQDSGLLPLSQDVVRNNIGQQLSAANITSNVTINSIELGFYDSGNQFIQPVFRYNVTISHPFGLAGTTIIGYVPAGGKAFEPLPSLIPAPNQQTSVPADSDRNTTVTKRATTESTTSQRRSPAVTIGMYLMQKDQLSPQWVINANSFWTGISSASNAFAKNQYWWALPQMFEGDASEFINDVNLAYYEGHGNVAYFTTDEELPSWGGVSIPSALPSNGYGPGAGGSLCYWLIHSCDVVASVIDSSDPFAAWWQVMDGMHAVLGFRTAASPNDSGDTGNVGSALASGVSVVNCWMNNEWHAAMTSVMIQCGHDDDTVFDRDNLGPPNCLKNIYQY